MTTMMLRRMLLPSMAATMGSTPAESASSDESNDNDEKPDQPLLSTVIVIAILNKKTERKELFRVLLDTGSNRCMGTQSAVQRAGLTVKPGRQHRYRTAAGTFTTTHTTKIRAHHLLELNSRRVLQNLKVQVTDGALGLYDFIFGRDYLNRYGIDLLFSEGVIQWDGMRMKMKDPEQARDELKPRLADPFGEGSDEDWLEELAEHYAQHILDNTYAKSDVAKLAHEQDHLTKDQQDALYQLLDSFQDRFQGQLGEWPDFEVSAELKPGAIPYHCTRPIRIPHAHMETLKKEVQRLVDIGVLVEVDGSQAGPWCAPSFIVKKKDGKVRIVTDFRELNKRIQRKPWPMRGRPHSRYWSLQVCYCIGPEHVFLPSQMQ